MSPLIQFQLVSLVLLCLGLFGIVTRRSLIGVLISVELILNGAGLSVMAAAQYTEASAVLGHLATLLIMGLAAAEATLVLSIIVVVARRFGSTRTSDVSTLKE